jgi:hypothetical protein
MKSLDRITFDPNVMGGKPCIRGMRVTVGTIGGLVASGYSFRNYLPKNRFIKTTKDTKAAQRARRMIFYPFVSFVSTLCPLW